MGGLAHQAEFLFPLAKEACGRTATAASETEPGQMNALAAVVLAAATLEAFINDAVTLAKFLCPRSDNTPEPPKIQNFVAVLEEVEECRGSVELKYMCAKTVLSGQPYDRGTNPYQDFSLLMKLRNSLMHLKHLYDTDYEFTDEGGIEVKEPPVVKKLPQNLLPDPNVKIASWVGKIATRAVARWACNTTVSMITSFVDALPESKLKQLLGWDPTGVWQPCPPAAAPRI